MVKEHDILVTIEEGSQCGFGAMVLEYLAKAGHLDGNLKVRTMTLPDTFQDQDKPEKQYEEAGLSARNIVEAIKGMGKNNDKKDDERMVSC